MAYPMRRGIPYGEFLEQLKSLGVEIKQSEKRFHPSEETIKYLQYTKDGKVRHYPLTFSSEADVVQWSVLRSVCSNLELDPALFGLTLG